MNRRRTVSLISTAALAAAALLCFGLFLNLQNSRDSMKWAKNLRAGDVKSIELVIEPSEAGKAYRLFKPADFPEIVELVRQSRGGYVPNPEALAGSSIALYITGTDGFRHQFINSGNAYLIIDGDFYGADYSWLSSWKYTEGDAPLPAGFFDADKPLLTMEELKAIAKKGEAVTWSDFEAFQGTDAGSGLYIRTYAMAEPYHVSIGGPDPKGVPMYVYLYSTETGEKIDIRKESVDDFISGAQTE